MEAQIASLADRIVYNCHDLEDAIGAEFLTSDDLAGLARIAESLSNVFAVVGRVGAAGTGPSYLTVPVTLPAKALPAREAASRAAGMMAMLLLDMNDSF